MTCIASYIPFTATAKIINTRKEKERKEDRGERVEITVHCSKSLSGGNVVELYSWERQLLAVLVSVTRATFVTAMISLRV